ncbi:MAG: nickel insertion protein [Halobacteriaceae archaeon]
MPDTEMRLLETSLDDATPETLGTLQESLLAAGAANVTVIPTTGKRARPGHLVQVMVEAGAAEAVAKELARETGTLGVRELPVTHRFVAETDRRIAVLAVSELDADATAVGVKVAWMDDAVYDLSAEHAEATAVATRTGLATKEVAAQAEAAVRGSPTDRIVHLVPAETWAASDDESAYAPSSVEEAGFVHCAKPEQVPTVANANFDTQTDLRALVIDPRKLSSPVRYEATRDRYFPHVYGPLDRDAIVAEPAVPRGPDGFEALELG